MVCWRLSFVSSHQHRLWLLHLQPVQLASASKFGFPSPSALALRLHLALPAGVSIGWRLQLVRRCASPGSSQHQRLLSLLRLQQVSALAICF
jgi:hypothetical protein